MDYSRIFHDVSGYLARIGQGFELSVNRPATRRTVDRCVRHARIPESIARLYLTFGNGFLFRWTADDDPEEGPFAMFEFPSTDALIKAFDEWHDLRQLPDNDFSGTKNPALAKRTALRMEKWLPLIAEGNGDYIALNLGARRATVVYDEHDWFDGGSGTNGHILAPSWEAFFKAWSQVCFQVPLSLHWPSTFDSPTGVKWKSKNFTKRFRRPA